MKCFSLFSCLFILLLLGCNEVNPSGEKEVRKFVKQWNDAHTQIKSPYLERYYMDIVTYYEKEFTRDHVQQDKNLLFQQFPDYTQGILNDQSEVTKVEGSYLVTFTKHVNYNGVEADYPSYLSVTIKNGEFKIMREGWMHPFFQVLAKVTLSSLITGNCMVILMATVYQTMLL